MPSSQTFCCLSQLREGQSGQVSSLSDTGQMRRRVQDLGLIEGTAVQCLQKSAFGDPCAYLIRGAVIALRSKDSQQILVRLL